MGSAAPIPPPRIPQRALPFAVLLRHWVWQRHPVSCGGFSRRAGIPDRHAHVEIARAVRLVGLGRELVDGRRVEGVPPLLRALDVAIVAAPLAEEVARQSLAVRASPASAFCGFRGASSSATGGPAIQARLTTRSPLPVGLASAFPLAAGLRTRPGFFAQDGGRDEARRELATPLGDEGFEVHGVLRFRVATRCASVPERSARARRAVTSRQRGQSASEGPPRLTARARVTRWRADDGRRVVVVDGADADPCGGRRAAAERAAVVYRVVVQLGQAACRWDRLRWYGLTARRAEAIGIATRRARTAERAWSPKAKEPGPPPAASPTMAVRRRSGFFAGTLATQTGHTTDTACGRLGCARKGARRAGRERTGCEDDAEHRDMAARCRGPGCPPAPGYQRTAALVASRDRVRRSRTPWRPLTRRWRRATISGRCSGKNA